MNNISTIPADIAISTQELVISLLIGTLMALILQWHFKKFSLSSSNRAQFSAIFVYIILTVTLIISLIKSSFALSLGLIGALSIVRFRTPIKDPEELAYLFLTIAIGLGLGAKQYYPTAGAFIIVLAVTAVIRKTNQKVSPGQLLLNITYKDKENINEQVQEVRKTLEEKCSEISLKRLDQLEGQGHLLFSFSLNDKSEEAVLIKNIQDTVKGADFSIVNQEQIL